MDYYSGYRPFIGWLSGICLGLYFIPYFILGAIMWISTFIKTGVILPYPVNAASLLELIGTILSLSAIRTYEKIKKVHKQKNL